MARRYLSSLLFRQALILALIAGACVVRAPAVGAALFFLLVFVPERGDTRAFLVRLLKLLAAFVIGFAAMHLAMPDIPDKPSWAAVPRQAVFVEGKVDSATGLPGGRVRVLLSELKPRSLPPELNAEEKEKLRKAMRPPRFASGESGRKSYAGAVFQDEAAALPGLASLTLDAPLLEKYGRPLPGQTVTALLRLCPSGGSRNAEESGPGAYWAAREVWHNARLVRSKNEPLFLSLKNGEGWLWQAAALRESWRKTMMDVLAEQQAEPFPQGKAVLTALLFGDRSVLSQRTIDLFTRAGLVHSLALSGQHLALASMFGVFSIVLLACIVPRLYQSRPRRTLIACAGLPFALGYLFLGGAPFSLIRASFMMLAGAVFLCLRRATAPLDALFAAVLLLFIAWPLAVFDLSAQLSVLAVAGIMLSLPLISALNGKLDIDRTKSPILRTGKKLFRAFASLLIVSCAAQVAVFPILASVFGAVSPCFWLNLVWLPPLTFFTLPLAACGLLLTVAGCESCAALVFGLAAWPADMMLFLLEKLDAAGFLPLVQCLRPAPLSSLGYGAVLVALAFLFQTRLDRKAVTAPLKRLFVFGAAFLLLSFVPRWADDIAAYGEKRVTLTMIDVGAGQAVLLEYPGGRILVDGGGNTTPFFDCGRSIVAPKLTEGRLPRLDAVIVSHCDVDHARGLRWILEHFRVSALYWSPVSAHRAHSGEGKAIRELALKHGIPEKILHQGDTLELGQGLKLEVLAPLLESGTSIPSDSELSSNNASLGLRLTHHGHGLAVLCGDMLSSSLRRLADSGHELKADALVLPHHGAASSFQREFYDAVSPSAALASAAPFSHFGFPSRKVREEMDRREIPLFSTSELGSFRLQWKLVDGRYAMELPAQ